jgi:hypothetical protein
MLKSYDILTANYLGKAKREQIIEWLVQNDSNGTYTDEQSQAEGLPPLSRAEALKLAIKQLEEA